jgi:acyl carrier protein phosphodiesterase
MALAQQDYAEVAEYLKDHISEWFPEDRARDKSVIYDLDIRERIVRVEEELKHQRELMQKGFDFMEKRFEQIDQRFEQILEQMDNRFKQVDNRFEQVDKRFEHVYSFMRWQTGIGFGLLMTIIVKLFMRY